MLQLLKDMFLGEKPKFESAPADRLPVATCAVLLEVALADDAICENERAAIESVLSRRFELTPEEIAGLIAAARTARAARADLFQFTRTLNEMLTPAERQSVMDEVWRVVFADGHLDAHEDHIVHRVGQLLNLTHRQLIDSKQRARGKKA